VFCPSCQSEYPPDWKRCPKDEASLLPSRHLGKYRIDGVIGAGGMGAVYSAFNPDTRSPVAIKTLHPHASEREGARTRFQREAAAVAALRTRHVIGIFDFGSTDDGTLYLVMELLEGHNLRQEVAAGPLELGRVNMILGGALRGLASAHRAGVTHRDLKPENIFIADTDDGEVAKVLDFGIARVDSGDAHALTQSGALMGTPAYMAPEQIAGNRGAIGPRTDVYAMGVILYELLTGRAPFLGDTVTEVLSRVLTRDFQPLAKVRPELPEPLVAVAERAMADSFEERFQSADAFRDAWQHALHRVDPTLQPTPPRTAERAAQAPSPMLATDTGDGDDAGFAATLATPSETPRPAGPRPPAAELPSVTPGPVVIEGTGAQPPPRRLGLWLGLGGLVVAGGAAAFLLTRGGDEPPDRPVVVEAADAGAVAVSPAPADAEVAAPEPPPGMVRFAGGTFEMGNEDPAFRHYNYDPVHTVELAPFWLDRTEMSVGTYLEALGTDRAPGGSDDAAMPVRDLTWLQAKAACEALGRRLPTEAEWEFAATRAPLDPERARLMTKGVTGPAPVGTHEGDCTPDGVCDLLGNVMEWTADAWREAGGPAADPGRKTVRGASYRVGPVARWYASPYARLELGETEHDPEVGFRCALDAPR
jgi:eukaryotic-like serine/threonine-protein kinase